MLRGPLIPLALTASIIAGQTLAASKPDGMLQFLKSHHAQTLTFRDESSEEEDEDDVDVDGSHAEDMKKTFLTGTGLFMGITNNRERIAIAGEDRSFR